MKSMIAPKRLLETDKDTICALATAHGIGAISVIRVSGPRAVDVVRNLAPFLPVSLESHKIYYGILTEADGRVPLDEVLVAYFKEGRSFTGEETFEISCHGGEVPTSEILNNLVTAGARPANRGEFTYRAFMNGRLDLIQAESVLAMIESRSPRAARLALRQLRGQLSRFVEEILKGVTSVLAHLEANIDYASEDIEIASPRQLGERVQLLLEQLEPVLKSHRQGRILRHGFQVALVGRPNAGKSSLLNALCGEDRAIVTPIAGTTRDFVEATLEEDGFRLQFIDTAGLRKTEDPIETIGVRRTLEKISEVDLVFYVVDGVSGIDADDLEFMQNLPWQKTALVINKMDLVNEMPSLKNILGKPLTVLQVSAVGKLGLNDLKGWLRSRLGTEWSEDSTMVSNARHFKALTTVQDCLQKTLPLILDGESPDLIALELQQAIRALYEILGRTYDDQVMDQVFKEFCLGK